VLDFLAKQQPVPDTITYRVYEGSKRLHNFGEPTSEEQMNEHLQGIREIKPRHASWVFRTFDDSGMCLLRGLFLGSLENSFP
jgi:hypothetical protein